MQTAHVANNNTLFANSSYVWAKDLPPARNQFVSFERRFTLSGPAEATLHVFADTRYRLFVNETFVAYGPGRFVTAYPEFDTHALRAHLVAGANVVRVEVNFYGCSSFQTMPDGKPGFIAAGGLADGSVDFATPGAWLATVHQAWDPKAPYFSFAQNPAELCDTRVLADELALPASHPVVVLPPESTPWNKPVPRTAPYPDYALVRPARILATGPIASSLRWGVQLERPGQLHAAPGAKRFITYATWIYSPRAQSVLLECFWTEAELNGVAFKPAYPKRLGNHGEITVELRAGWNFLSGNVELLLEAWPFLLGLPREAGVSLHALPDLACRDFIALSPELPERRVLPFSDAPSTFELPPGWRTAESDLTRITPARLTAWDAPAAEGVVRDAPFGALPEVATQSTHAAFWTFDFGDEFYGQPVVEVEAPAGSVLDIAYDDWKRADGCVNLYNSNPFTDAADRVILRGGRQKIDVLNPRGGIYLQLVLRAPAGTFPASLTVHDTAIRRRTTLNHRAGSFVSGDPILDWAWDISTHTLQTSTDEAYADCPWRERGSYIGDSLVNIHLHRLISHDLSVARRTTEKYGQAQHADGQLQGCAPAWLTRPHEDYTLLWIFCVRDYWAFTGDDAFVSEQLPRIRRIFSSPTWKTDADGLWDTTGMRVFMDWGVLREDREGPANAAVNIMRIGALRATAELLEHLGQATEAAACRADADRVAAALLARVWDDATGRLRASSAEAPGSRAIHANILALTYGVGPADRILAYLEPLLRNNYKHGVTNGQFSGYAELYFFHFLFPALANHGRHDLVAHMIREHYGFLKELGYPSLSECFSRASVGVGSCCHSWGGAAAYYATEYVLGLRLARPGRRDAYVLAPADTGHARVEGAIPHPNGLIHVRIERAGSRFIAHASLPPGVTLAAAPNVELTSEVASLASAS